MSSPNCLNFVSVSALLLLAIFYPEDVHSSVLQSNKIFNVNRVKSICANIYISTALVVAPYSSAFASQNIPSISDVNVLYNGESQPIKKYLGTKGTLIFNFGSQCDLPGDGEPQCQDLIKLYKKYKSQGFEVLAFLTEQFRDKSMLGEANPVDEVKESLQKYYNWDIPIFDYVDVNGLNTAEIYKVMKDIRSISTSDLKKINWNFEKFLIDKDGVPVRRYRPSVMPKDLENDVNSLITTGKLKPRPKVSLGAN